MRMFNIIFNFFFSFEELFYFAKIIFVIYRDVNGVRRVWVVALPYPTCWINIHPVPLPVPISMQVSVMRILTYFFNIHGYPRVRADIYKINI